MSRLAQNLLNSRGRLSRHQDIWAARFWESFSVQLFNRNNHAKHIFTQEASQKLERNWLEPIWSI